MHKPHYSQLRHRGIPSFSPQYVSCTKSAVIFWDAQIHQIPQCARGFFIKLTGRLFWSCSSIRFSPWLIPVAWICLDRSIPRRSANCQPAQMTDEQISSIKFAKSRKVQCPTPFSFVPPISFVTIFHLQDPLEQPLQAGCRAGHPFGVARGWCVCGPFL